MVGGGGSASADIVPADPNCSRALPTGSPIPAIPGVLNPQPTCVKSLQRTLVFVGQAILNNGVNFAGTGSGAAGGTFDFDGICVMVDWQNGTGTSAPVIGGLTPCVFGSTGGYYTKPGDKGNFVGQTLEGKTGNNLNPAIPTTPNANVFDWNPDDQASCFNSSGGGTSVFTSRGALGSETWTSTYTWNNSLNNFVGGIFKGTGTVPANAPRFNAKIRTDADPAADVVKIGDRTSSFTYAIPVDRTDAGCLDKTLHQLNPAYDNVSPSRIGLQALVVSGNATWDIVAPGLG